MKEERRWLQAIYEAHYNLLCLTGDKDCYSEDFEDFRKNIDKNFIKTVFPIFKDIKTKSEFSFQWGDIYHTGGITDKQLVLCIFFPRKNRKEVEEWKNNIINLPSCSLGEYNFNTWVMEVEVKDIINYLISNEIKELREECENLAKPYYENKDAEISIAYEEQCLKEDEYYLGVRFISFDGEYPNYCNGNVVLEIEGAEYEFNMQNLMDSYTYGFNIDKIKPTDFDENIRRYYHEIIRVLKRNLKNYCCGGCQ